MHTHSPLSSLTSWLASSKTIYIIGVRKTSHEAFSLLLANFYRYLDGNQLTGVIPTPLQEFKQIRTLCVIIGYLVTSLVN